MQPVIAQNCAACHGEGLAGGLQTSLLNGEKFATVGHDDSIRRIIREGLPDQGVPPAGADLPPARVDELVRFIHAHEKQPVAAAAAMPGAS